MKLFITGGAGQLGVELNQIPLPGGWSRVSFARADLDISDKAAVLAAVSRERPDIILNAAAYTAVDKAEDDRDAAFAVNCEGAKNLALAAKELDIPLIHVSTDYVYDGSKDGAWIESDAVAPLGVYGASKEAGEAAIRETLAKHVILRTSWVYAAHGSNFVKTMLRVGADRDELTVVADQFGAPTSAGDIAAAMIDIAKGIADGNTGNWGTYHYAAKGETSWHGFADTIFEMSEARTGRRPAVSPIPSSDYPTPAARPKNSVMNCDKVDNAFAPTRRSWREGLADVLDDLLNQ